MSIWNIHDASACLDESASKNDFIGDEHSYAELIDSLDEASQDISSYPNTKQKDIVPKTNYARPATHYSKAQPSMRKSSEMPYRNTTLNRMKSIIEEKNDEPSA